MPDGLYQYTGTLGGTGQPLQEPYHEMVWKEGLHRVVTC